MYSDSVCFCHHLTCWRANVEIAVIFFDFFLGSKSDILCSFGTFLAHIGGFFLNELTNQFTTDLLFFFAMLQSIWRTREKILNSLSFCLTFFGSKSNSFGRFGTFLAHIGTFPPEWVAKLIWEQFILLPCVYAVILQVTLARFLHIVEVFF